MPEDVHEDIGRELVGIECLAWSAGTPCRDQA